MIMTLISIELYKIFKKWRTYIGFIAFGVFIPLMIYAINLSGNYYVRNLDRQLGDDFLITGNLLNGYFVSFIILQAMIIHVPFFITLVGGDLFAGEGTAGTYRMLLSRPVKRGEVVYTKFTAGYIYAFVFTLFFAVISLLPSLYFLGTGDLIVAFDKLLVIPKKDLWWRFLLAYGSAFISMCVVVSLSSMFSSFVNNAIGPIIATMAVIVIFTIVSELPFEFFEKLSPYLFTRYMVVWLSFFDNPIDWQEILKSIGILILHCFIFFGVTYITFTRKDILS